MSTLSQEMTSVAEGSVFPAVRVPPAKWVVGAVDTVQVHRIPWASDQ